MSESDDLLSMVLSDAKERMQKAVAHTQADMATVRTGRASPALVEKLKVDVYGSEVALQTIAGITAPEARMLVIQPYDRSTLKTIERAIIDSDLGMNPNNDGALIRLNVPALTEERRKEFVKIVRHKAEDGRVGVRSARRHAKTEIDSLQKEGEVGEDDADRGHKTLEKLTHDHILEIDKLLEHKEQELLQV